MKAIIINADDFGLHSAVNKAVKAGFEQGALTSASLMAGGAAFAAAADYALRTPRLGLGIHLTLVGGIAPVAPPERVRSLLDKDGRLWPDYGVFLQKYCTGRLAKNEIYTELAAQVQKIVASGIKPDHIDSHQHLHILPFIRPIVAELARRQHIYCVRIPDEPFIYYSDGNFAFARLAARNGLTLCAKTARYYYRRQGFWLNDSFWGMLDGGHNSLSKVERCIERLPRGVSEYMLHPAISNTQMARCFSWQYEWEQEYELLVAGELTAKLRRQNVGLMSYGDIIKKWGFYE